MPAMGLNMTTTTTIDKVTNIQELSHSHYRKWDEFVEKHPKSNMYQLVGWKGVLEKTFGFRSYYLMATNNEDEIVGILPIFFMTDILGRKYLISNPFSNFSGLCTNNSDVAYKLLERAFEIAKTHDVQYLEIRQLENGIDFNGTDLKFHTKKSFVTLMLPLDNGSEYIWKALSSRNRGKIRKAEKNGLICDLNIAYLDDFYDIWTRNLRRLGTPIYPYSFFENIIREFPNRVNILVLKKDTKVVAAMFLFKFKHYMSEPWVASLTEYNKIYVNNLLYWRSIEYACNHNFKEFDFGRSTVNSGTFNFKTQWGANTIQLYYQYLLNKSDSVPQVDAHNNKYQSMIDLWKKMPLSLTKFLGPKIVRKLPEL